MLALTGGLRVNADATESWFIASLNVTTIGVELVTPRVPWVGVMAVTWGGVTSTHCPLLQASPGLQSLTSQQPLLSTQVLPPHDF